MKKEVCISLNEREAAIIWHRLNLNDVNFKKEYEDSRYKTKDKEDFELWSRFNDMIEKEGFRLNMNKIKDIDFSKPSDEVYLELVESIESGVDPLELCIMKWKYVIENKDWSCGSKWNTCALCVKYNNFHNYPDNLRCSGCPLNIYGHKCNNSNSAFNKFDFTDEESEKMVYAKEMLALLEDIRDNKLRINLQKLKQED